VLYLCLHFDQVVMTHDAAQLHLEGQA
jgi:hypothetical protein